MPCISISISISSMQQRTWSNIGAVPGSLLACDWNSKLNPPTWLVTRSRMFHILQVMGS